MSVFPWRMSPISAISFSLFAIPMLPWPARLTRLWLAMELMVLLVIVSSFIMVLGHVYQAASLYSVPGFSVVALHTALGLLLLTIAVLSVHPRFRLARQVVAPDRAGAELRRLLPAAILLPVIVGWLLLQGQQRGVYGGEIGLAMFTTLNMLGFSVLVWWNSQIVRRSDHALLAHQQLTFANRDLEEFTASAAHDLRAPLNAMSGHCGMLREVIERLSDEEASRRLERIEASVRRMDDVIEGMLGLAQLTKIELMSKPVDLNAVAAEVIRELQLQYPGHRVRFHVDCGAPICADPRLMHSLLANLLDNAWKYTTRTDEPSVTLTRMEDTCGPAFVLRDNGVGFDMNFAQHLFEPFRRMHTLSEFPGVGIGLATAARIVQRYGGRIWANSVLGQGTSFYFTLPQSAATRNAERVTAD